MLRGCSDASAFLAECRVYCSRSLGSGDVKMSRTMGGGCGGSFGDFTGIIADISPPISSKAR